MKNGKLRICVNLKKLNEQTIKDSFSLPFTDTMLDQIGGAKMYKFVDGYSGYNQINLAVEEKDHIYHKMGSIHVLGSAIWIF